MVSAVDIWLGRTQAAAQQPGERQPCSGPTANLASSVFASFTEARRQNARSSNTGDTATQGPPRASTWQSLISPSTQASPSSSSSPTSFPTPPIDFKPKASAWNASLTARYQAWQATCQGFYKSMKISAADLDALINGVQNELPVTSFKRPNPRQVALLDHLGVQPDAYKTEGASDATYDAAKEGAETFKISLPGKQPASGMCRFLVTKFKPGVNVDDLDRDDGYKLVGELFKVKANDMLDLYLNYGFDLDMLASLRKLKTREQGASLVANLRKRPRPADDLLVAATPPKQVATTTSRGGHSHKKQTSNSHQQ